MNKSGRHLIEWTPELGRRAETRWDCAAPPSDWFLATMISSSALRELIRNSAKESPPDDRAVALPRLGERLLALNSTPCIDHPRGHPDGTA